MQCLKYSIEVLKLDLFKIIIIIKVLSNGDFIWKKLIWQERKYKKWYILKIEMIGYEKLFILFMWFFFKNNFLFVING